MYNNPFNYSQQVNLDRINAQMNELEKIKQQLQQPVQQPTNLTQNFQIAPTNRDVIKYASSMEEVQKDMVMGETPYFSKDMSVVWIKNTKGEIKTYELNEIVPIDEKDLKIQYLETQIEELKKGMISNEQYVSNGNTKHDETSTTEDDESVGTTIEKNKSTSISRISKSKTK